MDQFLKQIIVSKKTCVFVSPHFDDAVLSAGALLSYLGQHTNVVVINVFTKASQNPTTLSARAYLKQCGYTDAMSLYQDRTKEDAQVLGTVAKRVINLGFVDALWRKKYQTAPLTQLMAKVVPEFSMIYPTYKFHISRGMIATEDTKTAADITKALRAHIDPNTSIVFCPAGIGNHVDHVLVKQVCQRVFPNSIFWSDFPYNERANASFAKAMQVLTFIDNLDKKRELIEGYTTQFQAMFAGGLAIRPELFYVSPLSPYKVDTGIVDTANDSGK